MELVPPPYMAGNSAFDYQFKFCLVGPSRVGKTSIKVRATDNIYSESYLATIGPEFVEIVIYIVSTLTRSN